MLRAWSSAFYQRPFCTTDARPSSCPTDAREPLSSRLSSVMLDVQTPGNSTHGRGLHSSTFQLNSSALYGIGGARRGCVACVKGVLRGAQGC